MKPKYKNLKRGSKVTFQWRGLFYRAQYQQRYYNKTLKSWAYIFNRDYGSTLILPCKEVEMIFYDKK